MGLTLEDILSGKAAVSAEEISIALTTESMGGTLEYNEATQEWEGVLPEGYSESRLTAADHTKKVFMMGWFHLHAYQ